MKAVPNSVPITEPRPPMMIIARNWIENRMSKPSIDT